MQLSQQSPPLLSEFSVPRNDTEQGATPPPQTVFGLRKYITASFQVLAILRVNPGR